MNKGSPQWGPHHNTSEILAEGHKNPGFRFDGSGGSFQTASVEGMKNTGGSWFNIGSPGQNEVGRNPVHREISAAWRAKHYDQTDKMHTSRDCGIEREGRKGVGIDSASWADKDNLHPNDPRNFWSTEGTKQTGSGREWFAGEGKISRVTSSKSSARKAASAHIAKIPFVLASWIARAHKPMEAIA